MITEATIFKPIAIPGVTAIAAAYVLYQEWGGNFLADLDYYLAQGVVISRANLFGMARPIEHPDRPGEVAWFVRMSVGRLADLLEALPKSGIKWICFCRHKKLGTLDPRIRVYSIERAKHLSRLKGH